LPRRTQGAFARRVVPHRRPGRGRSDIRLNFTYPNEAAIEEGVRRLAVALARLADRADLALRNGLPIEQLTPIV
jgi:hypothetical protein